MLNISCVFFFFFSSRRRHTRFDCDWSSDVCSSDLLHNQPFDMVRGEELHAHVVPVTRTLPRIIGAEARATAYSCIETRVIGGQRSVEDRRLRTEEHDTVDGRETGKMRQAAI